MQSLPLLRQRSHHLGAYFMLVLAVSAWGGSFVAARMILNGPTPESPTLTPTALATVRFLLASAIFLPILLRQQFGPKRLELRDLPVLLLVGQLGISIYFWLQYTGVRLTNAGIAAVLVVGLIPLATMLISGLMLHESLGTRRALALGVGAVGVAIVAGQRGVSVGADGGFLFGAVCLVANTACFAVYTACIRGLRSRYSSLTTTAAVTIAGAAGLLLLAAFSEDWRSLALLTVDQWAAIAYLGLICSVMAYFFYNHALSQIEASRVAAWIYLEPPVAVVFGWLLLGEAVSWQTIAGGVVILAGLGLAQKE